MRYLARVRHVHVLIILSLIIPSGNINAAAIQAVNPLAKPAQVQTKGQVTTRPVSDMTPLWLPPLPVEASSFNLTRQKTHVDEPDIVAAQPALSGVEIPPADAVIVVPSAEARAQSTSPQKLDVPSSRLEALGTSLAQVEFLNAVIDANGSDAGAAISPLNVAFKLDLGESMKRAAQQASATFEPIQLAVDYSQIEIPFGGDFLERMALYEGYDCMIDANNVISSCASLMPLRGYLDPIRQQVVATLDQTTLKRWSSTIAATQSPQVSGSRTVTEGLGNSIYLPQIGPALPAPDEVPGKVIDRRGPPVLILSSGSSSPVGDYTATPIGGVMDYQVGLQSGSASTNFPIPVPPAAAGPTPEIVLTYDSASVDGATMSRSAQPGSVGVGWDYKTGSIVRLLRAKSNGDLCWTDSAEDFVFSLNGMNSRLVRGVGDQYALRDDPRWRVQIMTSTLTTYPDYEKRYWQVTSPDGTKYRFGGEYEPETGVDQNSIFWVPAFQKYLGSSSCSGTIQNRSWQWNLDRIEDTNGNVVSYFYEQEQNYYDTTPRAYIRAGHVKRIEYSKRTGSIVQPHARALFHTEMRCDDPLSVSGCDTTVDYPDTPSDMQCGSGSCTRTSASFWTYRRLHAIQTQVTNTISGTWQTAAAYELSQTLPTPPLDLNGMTTTKRLQLNSIAQLPGGDFSWSPYNQIEAEDFDGMSGITTTKMTDDVGSGDHIEQIQANDYLRFKQVNFSEGANLFLARVWSSAAMSLSIRLDSPSSTAVFTVAVPNQSSVWKTVTSTVSGVTGTHDVYVYFTGSAIDKVKLNWLRFRRASVLPQDIPPVQFGYVFKATRAVITSGMMFYQMTARLMTITHSLGGITEFTYGQTHPCPTPAGFTSTTPRPTLDCFVGYYTSDLSGSGDIYWHKYKVLNVNSWDTFTGNSTQTLTYTYSSPIYAYYDDPTRTNRRYWNDFRGHMIVTETKPSGVKTEHRFYRAVNGDAAAWGSSVTSTVNITLSDGTVLQDSWWLRGREAEVRVLSVGGSLLDYSRTIYTATLTAGTHGIEGAYFAAPQTMTNTTYATVNKTTQDEFIYDSYGNVIREVHKGDINDANDDRTLARSFVYSTTGYIVNTVVTETLWAGTAPGMAGNEKVKTEFAYDGLGIGVIPLKGNATLSRGYTQVSPSTAYIDTRTGYDSFGRVITSTDGGNNVMTTTYHSTYGYAQVATNTLGHVVTTVSDSRWGVPLNVTDANGHVTTLQYDGYGRRTKVWLPTEPTSGVASAEFNYNLADRPVVVQTRQLVSRTGGIYVDGWTYYDGLGRDVQSQTADTVSQRVISSKSYDHEGRVLYTSAPYSATGTPGSGYVAPIWTSLLNYHATSYNESDNAVQDATVSQGTILFSNTTQLDGWRKVITDANGNKTDYHTDAFGKLITVTEYNTTTQVTRYTYDLQGNLLNVVDALGNTTIITYDLAGRKTSMTDPDMGTWSYGYDNNSNLTSQQDARNLWLYLEYDGLNRLIRKRKDTMAGTILSEWVYDAAGQKGLLSISKAYDALGTTEVRGVTYDARNRVTRQDWIVPSAAGGTFRYDYDYDEANHRTSLTYPGGNAGQQGEVVTKAYYTQTGQLNSVVSDDGTRFVDYTLYNPQGQMMEQRNDSGLNGLTKRVTYDAATLRSTRIYAGSGASTANLQDLNYTFANNGNITTLTDIINGGQKQCFGYDALSRLNSAFTGDATCSGYSGTGTGAYNHAYGYNTIGNIISNNGSAYTYGSNKPHAVTAAFGNTYGYDANGNQNSRTMGGTAYDFTFDYQNRLADVQLSSTKLATFTYDADGNRVQGTISGTTTVYVAGLYEYQGGATTKYYEGGAIRRTGYASNNGISYMLGDQLGSTSVIVGQNGGVQATSYYYPYGGNRGAGTLSDLTNKRFTGQYHESGLPGGEGLSYYNARWYDAQLGRFVSPDTIISSPGNPESFNRYTYVNNSPINYSDPTGHACDDGPQTWAACKSGHGSGNVLRSAESCQYVSRCYNLSRARFAQRTGNGKNMTGWLKNKLRANALLTSIARIRVLNNIGRKLMNNPGTLASGVATRKIAGDRFTDLVKNQAQMDYKHSMNSILNTYVLGTNWYENSTIGNVNFGFVGRAAGFSGTELHLGAGKAQLDDDVATFQKRGNLPSVADRIRYLGDDSEDYNAVEFGVQLYDRYGVNYTNTEFDSLLVEFASKMAVRNSQATQPYYKENSANFPLDYFDGPFDPAANDQPVPR